MEIKKIKELETTLKILDNDVREIKKMIKKAKRETYAPKCYVLHGKTIRKDYNTGKDMIDCRWLQFNRHIDGTRNHPVIQTRAGYAAYNVIAFKTEDEAKEFIKNFNQSPKRRWDYAIKWSIDEYKSYPSEGWKRWLDPVMTEYGICYQVKYTKVEDYD